MDNHPIDKAVKSFVQRRKIEPSPEAWQKLENMLPKAISTEKPWYLHRWTAVAAMFLLVIMIGLQHQDSVFQMQDPAPNKAQTYTKPALLSAAQTPVQPLTSMSEEATISSNKPIKKVAEKDHEPMQRMNATITPLASPLGFINIEKPIEVLLEPSEVILANWEENLANQLQPTSEMVTSTAAIHEAESSSPAFSLEDKIKNKYGLKPEQLLTEVDGVEKKRTLRHWILNIHQTSTAVFSSVSQRNIAK